MKILSLVLLLIVSVSCTSKTTDMKAPEGSLDLEKYLGTWYEIARFDHKFERGLQGVTANYAMRDDGKIRVLNSGYKGSLQGEKTSSEGKAKIPNLDLPRQLKVSFFWFFYADYNILYLDEDYQFVLIGSSSPKYLWLLSRTPKMEQDDLDLLLSKAKRLGYDTDQLIWVDQ